MSSESIARQIRRILLGLSLAVGVAGCQVRPLHDGVPGRAENLGSIAYSQADSRVGQEVRNQLIFLTGGGAGEPAAPQYTVDMKVESRTMGVLLEQSSDVPKAGRVIVSADYTLTRTSDGTVLRAGRRQIVAPVDYPEQEFAKLRAIRDAEDRGAHQLAELIRADIATIIGR
ncbi:LPS assembly lipoprotein LptE [Ciceribacter thiooxidans]|uniref:LPS assembly lipoprotein LptE n=1 Tax=Ciceribacter thiooxidans TaxID=1969821 RepID=A0ABV7HTJ7_9HYPH|nr:LPS assembly lipoprotein LptE [Ciceribacter thiooxidans]